MKIMRKAAILAMLITALILISAGLALAQEEDEEVTENDDTTVGQEAAVGGEAFDENENNKNKTYIILGCVLAIGIAGIASAIGLALAGSSAVAVTAEKPELFSKCLILQVLPMTQSVYGLLTAILLMMGAGLLSGDTTTEVTSLMGIGAIWIGLAVGLTGLSAINQGMVASSSISAVGRNPEVASKGIIFTVMPETIAIFGLLVGILLMVGLKLL